MDANFFQRTCLWESAHLNAMPPALRAELLRPVLPVLGVDEVRLVLHLLPECSHAPQIPHDTKAIEFLGSGGVVPGDASNAAAVAQLLEQLHDLQLNLEPRGLVRRGPMTCGLGRTGTALLAASGGLAVAPASSVSTAPFSSTFLSTGATW